MVNHAWQHGVSRLTTGLCYADVLKHDLKPNMELWLTNCLQVAAVCRFEAVNATCERNVRGLPGVLLRQVFLKYASLCTASYCLQVALSLQPFPVCNVCLTVIQNEVYP